MEIGRDMDLLVAEKIMKWKPICYDDDVVVALDVGDGTERFFTDPTQSDNEWSPSTDIKDAWLVIEEMKKYRFRFDISERLNGDVSVSFELTESEFDLFYTELKENSVTLAICKCALEAMGRLEKQR